MPRRAHLAFYRRRGQSLTVSAKATAGITATVKGKDMLAALMRAISKDAEVDLLTLVNAGLDDENIEAIQAAVAASIDRSLTLAAQLEVSSVRDDQALFSYDVDIRPAGRGRKGGSRRRAARTPDEDR